MAKHTNYKAISYFDAVRRHGSVREAARHLGLAASAVNRQILNFEKAAGLPLFERLPGGMTLTPAGEVFARHVIAVLQDERRATSELDALRGLRRGEITLVAAESTSSTFLPGIIGKMAGKYPGIQIRIHTAGSNSIPESLIKGEADLGIAFSLPRHRDLQQLAVGRFRLGAVMRPDHPLATEATDQQISFTACTRHRLILPSTDLSIHTLLDPQLRRFEGRMDIAAEANSVELMKNLTLALNAVSFQSRIGLEVEQAAQQLIHLPLYRPGPIINELGIYLRQGRSLSTAVDHFVALARDELTAREEAENKLHKAG
ncbi:MAG: LysR family transcriptional regulator [Rhodospirillales bacterium 20-60-12]|nr:MAG: LysR family transcriptional regulator [Rhodospirillales bacterium 20-60-12]HQT66155.1 LysR substrate-binding domain-containing protein [Acetobacteraceae bacterium]